jgi:SPP1 family holin
MKQINKERIAAFARLAVAIAAIINQILSLNGKNPLPYSDTEIGDAVSTVITVAATLWVWWKDNIITHGASIGHRVTVGEKRASETVGKHTKTAVCAIPQDSVQNIPENITGDTSFVTGTMQNTVPSTISVSEAMSNLPEGVSDAIQ